MYHLLPLTMFYTVLSHDVTATVLLLSKLYQTTCSYYCYSYIAKLLQFKSNYSSIAIAFTIATPITMLLQFRSNYWSAATTATTAASATATVAIQTIGLLLLRGQSLPINFSSAPIGNATICVNAPMQPSAIVIAATSILQCGLFESNYCFAVTLTSVCNHLQLCLLLQSLSTILQCGTFVSLNQTIALDCVL